MHTSINETEKVMDIKKIVDEAKAAAKKASEDFIASHGEPFFCGFAWVEVKVSRTNSKEAKELIDAGFEKSIMTPKTLEMWNPSGSNTQSMDVKEVGAAAFARVLSSYGLKAYVRSRAD